MEYCYIVRYRMIQNTLLVIKLLIKIHNYEYVMEDLKRIKRNNWVAKHPGTEHLNCFWMDPAQDDKRERTHRRLHLLDGNEVE